MNLTNTTLGPDPAVPRRRVRGVPDAPVHHGDPQRPARRRARRRCRRVPDLLPHRAAAVRAGAGDARRAHVPRPTGTASCGRSSSPAARTSTRCPSPWPCSRSASRSPTSPCRWRARPSSSCRWSSCSSHAAIRHPWRRHDGDQVSGESPGSPGIDTGLAWEQDATRRRTGGPGSSRGWERPPGWPLARAGGQVTLDWEPVEGAAGYLVRRSDRLTASSRRSRSASRGSGRFRTRR